MSEHREAGYIQLPPDSTGKKSGSVGRLVINFSGETSPTFTIGQTITGGTSTATGEIVGINRIAFAAGEGQLFIREDTQVGTFVNTEDLDVAAVTYAQVSSSTLETLYYQKNVLVDRQDPSRYMKIDDRGAARVSYADGSPTISTFGSLTTANVESLRQYVYAYSGLEDEFYDVTAGSGSLTYLPNERAVLMDTGFTASGDSATRQTHLYHPYQPGNTLNVVQSLVLGDTGKTNVTRRWGYFDELDGIFWELEDTTLYAVCRSSTAGGPSGVDQRVAQADFNVDSLDGTIDFNLDVSTANVYWMDLQWLGAGIVRFGVYEEDGTKTIAHIFENPNTNMTVYMKTASLPLRYEVYNRDTAVSNSQIKPICASVQNFGQIKAQLKSHSISNTYTHQISKASGELPILTLRPSLNLNGLTNHAIAAVGDLCVHNMNAACLKVNLKRNVFPSGASWNGISGSAVEWDEDAEGFLLAPSGTIWSSLIASGESKHFTILNESEQFQDDAFLILHGNDVTQPGVSITAEVISNDASLVTTAITWKELHQ